MIVLHLILEFLSFYYRYPKIYTNWFNNNDYPYSWTTRNNSIHMMSRVYPCCNMDPIKLLPCLNALQRRRTYNVIQWLGYIFYVIIIITNQNQYMNSHCVDVWMDVCTLYSSSMYVRYLRNEREEDTPKYKPYQIDIILIM